MDLKPLPHLSQRKKSSHSQNETEGEIEIKLNQNRSRRRQSGTSSHRSSNSYRSSQNSISGENEATALTIKEAALEIDRLSFFSVFRYAKLMDYLLMFLGLCLALVNGVLLPLLVFLFGHFFTLASVMQEHICKNNNTLANEKYQLERRLEPTRQFLLLKFSIVFAVTSWAAHALFMITSGNQIKQMRFAYMEAILRKDFIWFDSYIDRNLSMRMNKDVTEIRSAVGPGLPKIVAGIISSILLMLLSFWANIYVSLMGLLFAPLIFSCSFLKIYYETNLIRREQDSYEAADNVAGQILSNIFCVKVFEGEEKELSRYRAALFSPWSLRKIVFFGASSCALLAFAPMACHSLTFYVIIKYLNPEKHKRCEPSWDMWSLEEAPVFTRFILSFVCFGVAAIVLFNVFLYTSRIRKSLRAAAEVFFTIDWKTKINCMSNTGEIPREKAIGKLQMTNVFFDYPRKPFEHVLRNLTINIFPGQVVTLFGHQGSGKSTVLKLFLRLYDPKFGKVRLDGMNITHLNVDWIRSQFGMVSQEIDVFNTTVEENIRFGKLDADFDRIVEVCKRVEIHRKILDLPHGYQTVVGSSSSVVLPHSLLKRMSLARVLLQNPNIILLDDFLTDGYDELEPLLLDLIKKMRDKCTIVMTTSKYYSLVNECDTIFALKDGKIVEAGSHEGMLKKRGQYFGMLEETFEYSLKTRSYFTSQLANYKFAEAILRNHSVHDDMDKIKYDQFLSHQPLLRTVLLRHVVNRNRPLVLPPRVIGGFHRYCGFTFDTDLYYERWLVRNSLLQARDLRQQLLPLIQGYLDPARMETDDTDTPFSASDSVGIGLAPTDSKEALVVYNGREHRRRKSLKKVKHQFQEMIPDAIEISSQIPSKLLSETNQTESSSTMRSFKTTSDIVSINVIDDKLQRYFGYTVNSSADNQSLATDVSYAFWDQYNRDLIISMIKKYKVAAAADIRAFLRLAKYSWPYMIIISFTSVIFGGVLLRSTAIRTEMMKSFLTENSDEVVKFSVKYVINGFIALGVCFVQELILGFGTYDANNRMRIGLFKLFLQQPLEWFDSPMYDIEFLRDSLATDAPSTQIGMFTICAVLFQVTAILAGTTHAFINNYQPQLGFVGILILCYMSANILERRLLARFNYIVGIALKPADKIVVDIITNIRTVQLLCLEEFYLNKYRDAVHRCRLRRGVRFLGMLQSISHGLSEASYFAFFGMWLYIARDKVEEYTLEFREDSQEEAFQFLLISEIIWNCIHPAAIALVLLPSYQEMKLYAAMHNDVFKTHRKQARLALTKKTGCFSLKPEDPPPKLALVNVKYTWVSPRGTKLELKGVTAEFLPGQYVALVGSSWTGKEILLKIILNLISPMEGTVYLNERNYFEIEDLCIRKLIGFVEQDPAFIEEYSIAENIAYGDNNRTVSMDEVVKAAKFALIDTYIDRMEEKYETKIKDLPHTPKGFVFRQRLEFARTVIQNPKILLVDQANTSLDENSTEILLETLMKLREGRTMIVSSQRIEPIINADVIHFLADGVVTEVGTHAELVQKKGGYYEMYMSQRLFDRNENRVHERPRSIPKNQ